MNDIDKKVMLLAGADRKMASACKGADVAVGKGLAVQGKVARENQATAKKNVDSWLGSLGSRAK